MGGLGLALSLRPEGVNKACFGASMRLALKLSGGVSAYLGFRAQGIRVWGLGSVFALC